VETRLEPFSSDLDILSFGACSSQTLSTRRADTFLSGEFVGLNEAIINEMPEVSYGVSRKG
jgi:hypothetical protein